MKEPDYLKIQTWITQCRWYLGYIEEMIEEKIKQQQEDLHKFSKDGKEYLKKGD